MNREVQVRFCEKLGLQCPCLLDSSPELAQASPLSRLRYKESCVGPQIENKNEFERLSLTLHLPDKCQATKK
jgi:hypothetical protein